jgi:class 3 adenylate cyclase
LATPTIAHRAVDPNAGLSPEVILRDGAYFGRTVNVASRIADYVRPGEVSSARRRRSAGAATASASTRRPVTLKGLREALTLYKDARA